MYINDVLLTPSGIVKSENTDSGSSDSIIEFINKLEGWKTRCKNLHWSAYKKNIHVYLDEFLGILSDFQDSIAEDYMGIVGKFPPTIIHGTPSNCTNAMELLLEIRTATITFYSTLPTEILYKGIMSECENFIHNLNKYKYLFSLTDIKKFEYE